MEKIIIVSVSENGVIGKNGTVPWYSKEELNYFKNTTMGYPLIMGRKTFESLTGPLKGRLNIILTRNKNFTPDNNEVKVFFNLTDSLNYCESGLNAQKVFIIGGAEIYRETFPVADKIYLSRMKFYSDGDTFFPDIDNNIWCLENITKYNDFELNSFVRCSKLKKE